MVMEKWMIDDHDDGKNNTNEMLDAFELSRFLFPDIFL